MKALIVFWVLSTMVYVVSCGLAWSWILGATFPIWKLPVVGLLNIILHHSAVSYHRLLVSRANTDVNVEVEK